MENALPPKVIISQMIFGYVVAKSIYVAAKLNLADLIAANGPMSTAQLAVKSGAHEESLSRLLRALASAGIFSAGADGKYSLTPMAECLREDSPDSVKAMSLGTGNVFFNSMAELLSTVQTGEPGFPKAIGLLPFEYMGKYPDEAKIFDRMMTDIHGGETAPMIGTYDFSPFKTVVDIGGGNGEVITAILQHFPGVHGVLFDLPHVIDRAANNIVASGLSDRCELVGGSFFETVASGGDAYIMRHIIHDWSDDDAVNILTNCRKAMNPGGKVLVVEAVIEEGNGPSPFKWLDLSMLMIGGKERTHAQFDIIFTKAGLKLNRIVPFMHDLSVIEGIVM